MNEQWYVLYTKSKAEERLAQSITAKGYRVFFPQLEQTSTATTPKSGHRDLFATCVPFFPGYLFVKFDLDSTPLSDIQWLPGVRHILGIDGYPTPVADQVILALRQKIDSINERRHQRPLPFQKGDPVRITHGPLENLLATFDRPLSSRDRVQVLLSILGQAKKVQIGVDQLEQVKSSGKADSTTSLSVAKPKRVRRTRGGQRYIQSHS